MTIRRRNFEDSRQPSKAVTRRESPQERFQRQNLDDLFEAPKDGGESPIDIRKRLQAELRAATAVGNHTAINAAQSALNNYYIHGTVPSLPGNVIPLHRHRLKKRRA